MNKNDCAILFFLIVGVISLFCGPIVIPWSEARRNNPPESNPSKQCYVFPPNVTHIDLKKRLSYIWYWDYKITVKTNTSTHEGEFYMRYPTWMNDLNAKIGDSYIGRTDGKVISATSEIDILDCHNNLKYVMRSGDIFQTWVNGFNIDVSLEINVKGVTQYYINKNNLVTSNIDVYNNKSVKVAHLYQNKFSDAFSVNGWTWSIDIIDSVNSPIDPFILISIAGSQSFQEKYNIDDSNNSLKRDFRNGLYIALIVCFSLAGLFVVIIIGLGLKEQYANGKCDSCLNSVSNCWNSFISCSCWSSFIETISNCCNNCSRKVRNLYHNCFNYNTFNDDLDAKTNDIEASEINTQELKD